MTGMAFSPFVRTRPLLLTAMFDGVFLVTVGTKMGTVSHPPRRRTRGYPVSLEMMKLLPMALPLTPTFKPFKHVANFRRH
jgi:hypothetical protein